MLLLLGGSVQYSRGGGGCDGFSGEVGCVGFGEGGGDLHHGSCVVGGFWPLLCWVKNGQICPDRRPS